MLNWSWVISVSRCLTTSVNLVFLTEFFFISIYFFILIKAEPRAKRAIIIAVSLLCLSGLQGFMVIASYVTDILASSNPDISPIDASIGITMMLVGTNLIFMNIVDRATRRVFYIWSSLATTIGLAFFAAYIYYLSDNPAFDWVPIVCVSFSLIVSCLGMTPIPYIIMFEIVPEKVNIYYFSN